MTSNYWYNPNFRGKVPVNIAQKKAQKEADELKEKLSHEGMMFYS